MITMVRQVAGRGRQALRYVARGSVAGALRLVGLRLLMKPQTVAFLRPFLRQEQPPQPVTLPDVPNAAHPERTIYGQYSLQSEAARVWQIDLPQPTVRLLPGGGLAVNQRLLTTDLHSRQLVRDWFRPDRRPVVETDTLLAPFSHVFDGVGYTGYYDYMFLVVAKLARFKAALPPDQFARAVVAYPLLGAMYENDLLDRLGLPPDRRFDSRQTQVQANRYVLGNKDGWYYPNPADVQALRQYVGQLPTPSTLDSADAPRLLYVSRAGRRRVLNEGELVATLQRHGVTVVEDRPRSVAEQIALFHNADVIIGPHGAAFTNLLWCRPGTQVLELFHPRYTANPYLYLATVLGLRYAAYVNGPAQPIDYGAMAENITVNVADVERAVVGLLAAVAT